MSFSFGQNVASVRSAADLTAIKTTGKGQITMPSSLTSDLIQQRAKYYTLYFTVDFDQKTSIATIKMVENTERARAVIIRFLAGCEIQSVNVGGENVSRDVLFDNYLK